MAAHEHYNRRRQQIQTRELERLEDKYIDTLNTLITQFARDWADKQNTFSRERRQERARQRVERGILSQNHYHRRLAKRMDHERELRDIRLSCTGRWTYLLRGSEDEAISRHLDERDSQLERHQREKLDMEMWHLEKIEAMMVRHQRQESAMLLEHKQYCQDLRKSVFVERNLAIESWLRS